MDIAAQPVARAVHVEREVIAVRNHVAERADLVGVQQSEVEHALRQHRHGGIVRIGKTCPGAGGGNRPFLRRQHQVVERALRAAEATIGGKGARDVAGVAVEFAAGVYQHQFTIADGRLVGAVVQHTGVGTGGDDGAVGRRLRALLAKLVQQLGFQVVLAHVLAGAQHLRRTAHGADVADGADLGGAAHGGNLVRVLHQAHFVQRYTQVAQRGGAQRAVAHPGAGRLHPGLDTALQSGVGGKRKPDRVASFQQRRQLAVQLGDGKGLVHAQRRGCCVRAEAVAVPDLALQVLGLAKQGAVTRTREQQPRFGLGKAAEVVKVAVGPVREIVVAVALLLRRRRNEGDVVAAQLGCQCGAALGIEAGVHRGPGGSVLASAAVPLSWARRCGVPTSVQAPV